MLMIFANREEAGRRLAEAIITEGAMVTEFE